MINKIAYLIIVVEYRLLFQEEIDCIDLICALLAIKHIHFLLPPLLLQNEISCLLQFSLLPLCREKKSKQPPMQLQNIFLALIQTSLYRRVEGLQELYKKGVSINLQESNET